MADIRALAWFVITSWRYLGCDQGTGRWSARRRYVTGLPAAGWSFLGLIRADRKAMGRVVA